MISKHKRINKLRSLVFPKINTNKNKKGLINFPLILKLIYSVKTFFSTKRPPVEDKAEHLLFKKLSIIKDVLITLL
jgi:hypothetical protein